MFNGVSSEPNVADEIFTFTLLSTFPIITPKFVNDDVASFVNEISFGKTVNVEIFMFSPETFPNTMPEF